MDVLAVLLLVAALWRSGVSSRNCPDLIVDSCHCVAERYKELSRHTVRVKVVCEDADLLETLEPALLPNTTVTLILSNNKISMVKNSSFYGLRALERLDLRSNLISTVEPGAFRGLAMLKRLFTKDSTCNTGHDAPLELPLLQLIPSQRQLVFRGDRLPLQCTATYLDPSLKLTWSHEQRAVRTQEKIGVYVEESIIHDCCLITSELILSNVDADVAGNWQCHVTSSRGNSSIGMEIVVLETSAVYCSAERVTSNKGDFRWPKTLAGFMAFLPCATPTYSSASHEKRAWRKCDKLGRWAEEDYNQCPYSSKFTRVLHELTQIQVNTSNAIVLARQLSSFTSNAAMFGDMMDVIFVTHLVERITRLVDRIRELGDYVSDIASNMMQVEEHILWMAQNEARACTRIVQCVERIADLIFNTHSQNISKVSPNIALEAFMVRPSSVMGLLCTVVQRSSLAPPVTDTGQGRATGFVQAPALLGDTHLNFRCHAANVTVSPTGQLSQIPGNKSPKNWPTDNDLIRLYRSATEKM
ncbi:hypothetical protein NFI96_010401 [Prochilodus magdalenae]|nr:hypothetical protein NFI96_010401 [Prochilodus magdalenae]